MFAAISLVLVLACAVQASAKPASATAVRESAALVAHRRARDDVRPTAPALAAAVSTAAHPFMTLSDHAVGVARNVTAGHLARGDAAVQLTKESRDAAISPCR